MSNFEILELSENVSPEMVDYAYSLLKKRYNPDNYTESEKEWAQNKLKEITDAYYSIKGNNQNLDTPGISIEDHTILNCNQEENIDSHSSEDSSIKNQLISTSSENSDISSNQIDIIPSEEDIIQNPPHNPKKRKKRIIGLIFCISIILFMFIIVFINSNAMAEIRLDLSAAAGNFKDIVAFIDDNRTIESRDDAVTFAIDKIVQYKNQEGINYLEDMFFNNTQNTSIPRLNIIKTFNKYKTNFSSSLNTYKFFCIPNNDPQFTSELVDMIKRYEYKDVSSYFISEVKKDYLSDINKAILTFESFKKLELQNSADVDQLYSELKSLQTTINEMDNLNKEIPGLEESLSKAKSNIPSIEPFNLYAYMVAQLNKNAYEIALPSWTSYGAIPSANHAILVTSETNFTSKGWFNLRVIQFDEIPVQLKEELGNFTQDWKIYDEATASIEATIQEYKKTATECEVTLEASKQKLNSLAQQKKNIENNITSLIDKIIDESANPGSQGSSDNSVDQNNPSIDEEGNINTETSQSSVSTSTSNSWIDDSNFYNRLSILSADWCLSAVIDSIGGELLNDNILLKDDTILKSDDYTMEGANDFNPNGNYAYIYGFYGKDGISYVINGITGTVYECLNKSAAPKIVLKMIGQEQVPSYFKTNFAANNPNNKDADIKNKISISDANSHLEEIIMGTGDILGYTIDIANDIILTNDDYTVEGPFDFNPKGNYSYIYGYVGGNGISYVVNGITGTVYECLDKGSTTQKMILRMARKK